MKLSILLVTKEDGHFADVTVAHEAKPGESVEDLAARLFETNPPFKVDESAYTARIEIRLEKE